MTRRLNFALKVGLLFLIAACSNFLHAQTNNYVGLTNGKWENGANWSLGIPPNLNHVVRISNGAQGGPPLTKTVTIDATTAAQPANMIVSDLALGGTLVENILKLNNAGMTTPLNVLSSLIVSNKGVLSITGSSVVVKGRASPGEGVTIDGQVELLSGAFAFSNSSSVVMSIGKYGNGSLTIAGGTWTNDDYHASLEIGGQSGRTGRLNISGGTARFAAAFGYIGNVSGSTGIVQVTGGELITRGLRIGEAGVGQMTISNGLWQMLDFSPTIVGASSNGVGTLTVAGGTSILQGSTSDLQGSMYIGYGYGATGTVSVTGGELNITNNSTYVGFYGLGQMSVSGGIWRAADVHVGDHDDITTNLNSLTISGGTTLLSSNLIIGGYYVSSCGPTNLLTVNNGVLVVTNSSQNGMIRIVDGVFTLSGGTVIADVVDLTAPCIRFVRTGGTLIYKTALLDPARDDDGDGLPNGLEQSIGYDPLNPADGLADTDGDGTNNAEEILAGTNPTNSVSQLRIRSLTVQGDDIRIRWSAGAGRTNAIQAANSLESGGSNFVDLALIPITGTTDKTNTYIDVDGAKQGTNRFYRIKLVP